jgi:hypothetical protein
MSQEGSSTPVKSFSEKAGKVLLKILSAMNEGYLKAHNDIYVDNILLMLDQLNLFFSRTKKSKPLPRYTQKIKLIFKFACLTLKVRNYSSQKLKQIVKDGEHVSKEVNSKVPEKVLTKEMKNNYNSLFKFMKFVSKLSSNREKMFKVIADMKLEEEARCKQKKIKVNEVFAKALERATKYLETNPDQMNLNKCFMFIESLYDLVASGTSDE